MWAPAFPQVGHEFDPRLPNSTLKIETFDNGAGAFFFVGDNPNLGTDVASAPK